MIGNTDRSPLVPRPVLSPLFTTVPAFLALAVALVFPGDAATVRGTLGIDPSGLAGADAQGRVLLFAPNPVQPGSSTSHWDRSALPNLLMEPGISSNLPIGGLDLTLPALEDIGWQRGNSNVVLRIQDGPNEGFNDPQLGAQRRQAMQFAADLWGNRLSSGVTVNVDVSFNALTCGANGATLAQASLPFVFHSFAGASVGNTWYPGALAEALSGQNLSQQVTGSPDNGDLRLVFNESVDAACLGPGTRFHYGTSGNLPNGTLSFLNVALHEMGHGFGFASLVDDETGLPRNGRMDIFSRFMRDNTLGLQWHQMTAAQRQASAINTGQLVWNGPHVTQQAANTLQPGPALTITEPASVAGRYLVATANFGPPLSNPGISGEIVLARDATANPTLACAPLINGPAMQGRIALIDRGDCNFTDKVLNAQRAGARGAIIANNTGGGANVLGGSNNAITIPALSVSREDGQRLKDALEQSSFGTISMTQAVVQAAEGDGNVTVTVRRQDGDEGVVSVDLATVDGSATAGLDYQATAQTLIFGNGDSGDRIVSIPLLDDEVSENLESFTVGLTNVNGGANLGTPSSTRVDLADDEPCIEDEATVCLQRGRFRLQLDWQDFAEETGQGRVVPADSDNSALLYFFAPDNWEMLVKVIDGCDFNNHFWVFAAATTNVQYRLTVTDVQSGVTRFFDNTLGVSSPAITDTSAFATCP